MFLIIYFPISSPRDSHAIAAVKKGIELSVKILAAIAVVVIAHNNEVLAKSINTAAQPPESPIPLFFVGKFCHV